MDLTRTRRYQPTIDMTPMIDCVFQLLIFFLLTSAFRAPAVDLVIPSGQTIEQPKKEEITIEFDAHRALFVNSQPTTLRGLPAAVRQAIQGVAEPSVTVRAHGELAYSEVMKVVLATREGGVHRVLLAYEPEGGQ